MRKVLRSTALAAVLVAATSVSVQAQSFNFSTRGQFISGGASCNTGPAMMVECSDPGSSLMLTFTGRNWTADEPFGFADGALVVLGNFTTSGNGSVTAPANTISFRLWIDQTSPTNGTNSTVGFITGTLSRPEGAAAFSDLVWSPMELVTIGPVNYDLIFREDLGGIPIAAVGSTSIEAIGTVVPEPSTYVLMATGLAGLGFIARRRRNTA